MESSASLELAKHMLLQFGIILAVGTFSGLLARLARVPDVGERREVVCRGVHVNYRDAGAEVGYANVSQLVALRLCRSSRTEGPGCG